MSHVYTSVRRGMEMLGVKIVIKLDVSRDDDLCIDFSSFDVI